MESENLSNGPHEQFFCASDLCTLILDGRDDRLPSHRWLPALVRGPCVALHKVG